MLSFNNCIEDILSKGHPYDIITIDFKNAYDKASHTAIFQALANAEIADKALAWFISFFDKCTQQVKMGYYYSRIQHGISGLVQGSSIGAVVFAILIDSLLRQLCHFTVVFADDVKFLVDVVESSQAKVQIDIESIDKWFSDNKMPLSPEKSLVMHMGRNKPLHSYHLQGSQLKTENCYTDLGIIRSTNHGYRDYIDVLSMKASKTAGMLYRAFQSFSRQLLWPAFQSYVLTIHMYCCPAWCPNLQLTLIS